MEPSQITGASAALRRAVEAHKARAEVSPWGDYLRLSDDFEGMRRGTVEVGGLLLHGYPSIGRILRLQSGLREHFAHPFWVEEKVNGYNVRIVRVGNAVLAFTRGGFACPFTIDRLPDLLDVRIFARHPDLVLCAEIAGPENPYMVGSPPYVREDVRLFVFDMLRIGEPEFLSYGEKTGLIEEFSLPAVKSFGRYTAEQWSEVRDILRELDGQGLEGIVIKEDVADGRRGKCVTGFSDIEDIFLTSRELLDLPPEFYIGRVLRLALFLDEAELASSPLIEQQLGRAFLQDLLAGVRQFKEHHQVFHTFRCRFHDLANARLLLERVRAAQPSVRVQRPRIRREGAFHVLEFDKVHASITGLLGHLLGGGQIFD